MTSISIRLSQGLCHHHPNGCPGNYEIVSNMPLSTITSNPVLRNIQSD